MDWNLIKKKYPKAWEKFTDTDYYGLHRHPGAPRILYDFFDGEEIYIEILKIFDGKCTVKTGFYFYIDDYTRDEYCADTRTEAEEQAFLQCFEILENKLNSSN